MCKTSGCRYDEGIIWLAPATVYPNESFTFSSDIDTDPYALRTSSSWDKYFAEGTVKIWAIVDSYEQNHKADGYIEERHEDNNRYDVSAFTVFKASVPVAASTEATGVMLPQASPDAAALRDDSNLVQHTAHEIKGDNQCHARPSNV